ALDIALVEEGLPSLGILSASLARPSLQILKLATVFLWNPIDPFKILEFVSLSVKPLADDLATAIADQMAKTPGLNGEGWNITIRRYFDELALRAANDPSIQVEEIRRQYEFWFERRRYDLSRTVPKRDPIEIFDYVRNWAFKKFDQSGGKNNSLLVLSEQAKRIVELLHALPETELTYLELERIVRTIYEPSPVVFQTCEVGHLPYVLHPSAVVGPVSDLVWWNFSQNEPVHFFSRWYEAERRFLNQKNIYPETPARENARLVWQRRRPFLNTQNRMILVVPEMVDGKAVHPHPLLGDLEAAFQNLDDITFDLGQPDDRRAFEPFFEVPEKIAIPRRRFGKPRPFLHIANPARLAKRDYETLTSLETLFYYPYQWVFKYKIRLHKSSILSVTKDARLMGNLAHRLFEKMFRQDISDWDKDRVEAWIDAEADKLLAREGAVLLMYGREPERVTFLNRMKYAAWSLVSLIQENGWKVRQTEMDLEGNFAGVPVRGIADLVLERGDEYAIVDLKWRGRARRESMIRNEEDLQLVLYAHLLSGERGCAHTAYFIIENGKMVARNDLAFKNITAVAPDAAHEQINADIRARMEATYKWRMAQIEAGKVEIRTKQTAPLLENHYNEEEDPGDIFARLEMKEEDAPFCDYKTLIKPIE
ncbi:MAG: hypothetical protein D6714_14200, partial [Bacteroidetes bacterium]